jgi:diguanylate cyclase
MKLHRGKEPSETGRGELAAELEACQARAATLVTAASALVSCIKEFGFGLTEVNAERFLAEMEEVKQHLVTEATAAGLQRRFHGKPELILAFIQREKAYLEEREREFLSIIDLLRKGLSAVYDDNRSFTTNMQDHNQRMEGLIGLDDIRRIREQLQVEVETVRTAIAEKKAFDVQKLEELTHEVDALRQNLTQIAAASETDALTGAHNRLSFDVALQRMIDRYAISGTRFAVLFCDLDNFKGINDRYGHQIGDRVLVSFVLECRDYFRSQDLVARYGGDEFMLILPGAPLPRARKRAAAFCKRVAGKTFTLEGRKADEVLAFTVSIGVTAVAPDDTLATLIGRADRAMYLAKTRGKNRVQSDVDVARAERKSEAS